MRRLGETRMSTPDFRLICATNARLETLMADNRFREDLFFRINTVVLDIPPLRDRREDIPVLAQLFLQRHAEKYAREVVRYHPSVLQRLMKHVWRGNVRELEHVIEHAVIVATGREVQLRHLPESFRSGSVVDETSPLCTLEDVERAAIVRTLAYTRGNKRAAADILGVYRPTLYAKMRKYGLMAPQEEVASGMIAPGGLRVDALCRHTLDHLLALVRVWTPADGVVYANRPWRDLTGTTLEDNIGDGWLRVRARRRPRRRGDRPTLHTRGAVDRVPCAGVRRPGRARARHRRGVDRRGVARGDRTGAHHHAAGVPRAGRLPRRCRRWAHELRGPLNAILGWSDLLAAGENDPEVVRRGLQAIASNARQQAQVIKRMTL